MLTVAAITKMLEQKYPLSLAASWDNSGLQIGRLDQEVERVVLALDCTLEALQLAEQTAAQLIITHHPLIFSGIKSINYKTSMGQMLQRLCNGDISVYSLHTNLDRASTGLNNFLAAKLGLIDTILFGEVLTVPLLKLVVYVPASHLQLVREAMGKAGAGNLGNYSHCSFSTAGEGTFLPHANATPYLGKNGMLEKVGEYRLESIITKPQLASCLEAIRKVHPYEEMAYDVYTLENPSNKYGYGRCGDMPAAISLQDLGEMVKARLSLDFLRIVGNVEQPIKRVALVSGSGAGMIGEAASTGAQVLITGDIKYHEAQDALNRGLALIDAGHDGMEKETINLLANDLKAAFSDGLQLILHHEKPIFKVL